jgi:hypothetical protein
LGNLKLQKNQSVAVGLNLFNALIIPAKSNDLSQ